MAIALGTLVGTSVDTMLASNVLWVRPVGGSWINIRPINVLSDVPHVSTAGASTTGTVMTSNGDGTYSFLPPSLSNTQIFTAGFNLMTQDGLTLVTHDTPALAIAATIQLLCKT